MEPATSSIWPAVIAAIGSAAAASGLVGAILKSQVARATSTARQQREIFERQEQRIAALEQKEADCQARMSDLREELGRLRAEVSRLTQQAPAHVVVSERGRIIEWDGQAAAVFGWPAEDVIGKPFDIVIPTAQREKHARAFAAAVQRRATQGDRETPVTVDAQASGRDGQRFAATIILRDCFRDGVRCFSAEIRRR